MFTGFAIDQNMCSKCGECLKLCPDNAIFQETNLGFTIYEIDPDACATKCGLCWSKCPEKAIYQK